MPDVTSLFPDDAPVGARPFEIGVPASSPLSGPSLFPEDEGASRLRSAVDGAQAKSPDQAARVLRLQSKTGLPPELIERNVDDIEREVSRAGFDAEKFRRDSPMLAQWIAANPKHAEIAQGDLANLSRLDRLLGSLQRGGYSFMQSGSALSLGANARAAAEVDALDKRLAAGEAPGAIPDALDAAGYRWMSPEQRLRYRGALGQSGAGAVENIVRRQGQIEGIPQDPTIAAALGSKSFADFWYHFSQKPVDFVLTVGAESLPQMAPALALGVAGAVVGGLPLAAGGAGAGSFGVDYAASTLDALREEGVDLKDRDSVAAAVADKELMRRVGQKAFSHAAPVAAFDAAAAPLAGLRLVPAAKVAGVGAAKAIVAPAARGAAELGTQAVAQGTLGAAGEAAGLAASGQDLDAGQIMAEFFGEFAGAPAEVGAMAATGVRERYRDTLRAKERQAFFQALGEGVSTSKTFERMPEKLREYIAQATKDGPVENVYVPVEAWQQFWQSQNVDPREMAAEVTGQNTLYEEAIRTGADLVIPIADYATKIAVNAQANTAFSGEIRLRPDEMNAREAGEVQQELAAQAQAAAQDAPGATSAQKVREDIIGQLTGAGFDRGTVDAYASMYERAFATMGERAGVDPFALFQRYGLRVNRPLPEVLKPAAKVDALDALLDRVRSMDVKDGKDLFGESLLPFLRKRGVKDMGGELAGREIDRDLKPFQRKLVREDGEQLSDAMQAAIEAGYFPGGETDITDLLGAIDEELAGRPLFATKNVDERAMQTNDAVTALAQHLGTLGLDVRSLSNEEIKKALAAASGIEGQVGDVTFDQGDERTIQVDGKWRPVVNSQGQPIGRTFVEQLAFWRWFGDSKVVDAQGRPLVVYRGGATEDWRTGAEITEFRSKNGPWAGFFTSDPATASRFATAQYAMTRNGGAPAGVFPAYLRITQALETDAGGSPARDFQIDASVVGQQDSPLREQLLNGEHDGLIIRNTSDEADVFVPLDPTQIKSAIGNAGTFDPLSGSILHQEMSEGKRGRISFGADRQFNIDLLTHADLSTFIHETGHFYLEVFGDVVDTISAQDPASWTDTQRQMVRDYGDLLQWLGIANRAEISVDQHEQWARGIEAYMRDGKAPSRELRSVFAKFRSWLVNIYRSLTQLRVELSPEVRAVMDRLLATDREIESAQREADIAPLFIDAATAGMSEVDFAAYSQTVREAGERARDELQAKLFAQMKREQQAWWRQEREGVLAGVAGEIYARPEYVALSVLQRGTLPDGSPLPEGVQAVKLNRDWLVDSYGKEFLKRLPRPYVYAKEGGVNPELAAGMFGFKSGDELVMAIVNARPMRALIEAETDVRMKERHGDMMLDGTLAEAAKVAVNGQGRAQIVEAELKALNKAIAGSVIPPADVVNGMARDWIARQKVRDLRPSAYLMAAQRAAKEAFALVSEKSDRAGAMKAKLREQMNIALYREATRAQEQTEATVEYMRSFDRKAKRERIGKAGGDYLDQIDGLLDRFEFKKVSLKVLERRRALSQWAADKEKQGLPVSLPENLLDEARRQNFREMTVEELSGLRDAVKHIEHLATLKNKLLKAKAKRELDEAVADMAQSIRANAKSRERKIETRLPSDEAARLVSGWFASHRKLASFARQMDGFEDGGQVWEYIVRPINEAANEEAAMKEAATVKLGALFAGYRGKDAAELYRKRHIKAVNASLTKMGRLMIALNWGNEGNRQRIMSGYGWNESQVEAILGTLDERDWQFVQGVWDFIDGYWPQIEAKEKRVDGVAPGKVERAKYTATVRDALGGNPKKLELAGGYFPIKYDDRQSAKAGANLESEFADIAKAASYTRATTRRGHTEARVEKVDMPVRLDFGVIFEHVGQVIHDLSHHEMLLDAGRLLGHKELQTAIYDTYGDIVYRELKKSLVDVAVGDTPAGSAWEKSITHMRQGVSIAYMGWNLMTSLQQPLGLFNSMQRVGVKWVAKGVSRWLRDAASLENTAAWVHDRSEFMRLRHKTQQREISEIRNQVGVQSGRLSGWVDEALRTVSADHVTKQGIADSYFWLIGKAQMIADVPTWLGAYEKAAADPANLRADGTLDEDRVIALADQGVLDSQGGGQIKDLASVQRGGPMLKLWTNFYSIFNVTWNQAAEATRRTNFRDPVSIGRLAVDYLLLTIMPATMGALIKHAITGGDDDEEKFLKSLARENLSYLLGMMVGVREIGAASLGFAGYEGPAGARFFSSIGKFAKQSWQGEADAAFWKSLNETAGIVWHYPAGQVKRTVEGFNAMTEGRTVNPLALVFGPRKP